MKALEYMFAGGFFLMGQMFFVMTIGSWGEPEMPLISTLTLVMFGYCFKAITKAAQY